MRRIFVLFLALAFLTLTFSALYGQVWVEDEDRKSDQYAEVYAYVGAYQMGTLYYNVRHRHAWSCSLPYSVVCRGSIHDPTTYAWSETKITYTLAGYPRTLRAYAHLP